MKESDIEREVCDYKGTWTSLKVHVRHWPDRIFFGEKKVVFMEFKTEKGKLSAGQRSYFIFLESLGFPVYVVRSVQSGIEILNQEFNKR